jgi:hypothetical protein
MNKGLTINFTGCVRSCRLRVAIQCGAFMLVALAIAAGPEKLPISRE